MFFIPCRLHCLVATLRFTAIAYTKKLCIFHYRSTDYTRLFIALVILFLMNSLASLSYFLKLLINFVLSTKENLVNVDVI